MTLVFLCSTNGSVIRKVLETGLFKEFKIEFVSDRHCGLIEFTSSVGLTSKIFLADSGDDFSNKLKREYSGRQDCLFLSFYTRLLTKKFLDDHVDRVINFHPSILPACPGLDGFGDTIKSGALLVGATVHYVDSGVDTGLPILQTLYPRNSSENVEELRHRVFLQQCISLIQVVRWFHEKRILIKGKIEVDGAVYSLGEFIPSLDQDLQDLFQVWLKQST